jgi:hypothetical protein
MIKTTLKTLAFSLVTFATAAILSAAEQEPVIDRTAPAPRADSARVGCATPSEIDLGWEEQIQAVEKRLAEKEADGLVVPGAIITPPFETFAPYRTDVPPGLNASTITKSTKRHGSDQPSRN